MKLGKVFMHNEYIVDLDNEFMVDHAREALAEDVMTGVQQQEIDGWITVEEAPDAKREDIEEFLLDDDRMKIDGVTTVSERVYKARGNDPGPHGIYETKAGKWEKHEEDEE